MLYHAAPPDRVSHMQFGTPGPRSTTGRGNSLFTVTRPAAIWEGLVTRAHDISSSATGVSRSSSMAATTPPALYHHGSGGRGRNRAEGANRAHYSIKPSTEVAGGSLDPMTIEAGTRLAVHARFRHPPPLLLFPLHQAAGRPDYPPPTPLVETNCPLSPWIIGGPSCTIPRPVPAPPGVERGTEQFLQSAWMIAASVHVATGSACTNWALANLLSHLLAGVDLVRRAGPG